MDNPRMPSSIGDSAPAPVTDIADGVVRKLPDRMVSAERLGTTAVCIPTGLTLTAVGLWLSFGGPLDDGIWWIPLVALAVVWSLLLFLMLKWPQVHHAHLSWSLSPLRIEIASGVLWRVVTSVPRSRIQHTDVAQGPIQRRFGLATLSIHTAGSDSAQVDLSGLEYEEAVQIRDYLILRSPGSAAAKGAEPAQSLENPWAGLVDQEIG